MEAEVEQKTSDACMALAKRLACGQQLSQCMGVTKADEPVW